MSVTTTQIDALLEQGHAPQMAKIREIECIGCTKCIQACPVDAIIGSTKQLHTVLVGECIGCGLCVAPCPVDCIELVSTATFHYTPERARLRHKAQQLRKQKKSVSTIEEKAVISSPTRAYIQAAVERAKAKRNFFKK